MITDGKDLMNRITELEQGMQGIYTRARGISQWRSAQMRVEDFLSPDLMTISEMKDFNYWHDEARLKGKIDRPLEMRIIATSGLQRDIRKANGLEDIESGRLSEGGLNTGGWLYDQIIEGLISDILVMVSTSWQECRTPPRLPGEASTAYNARCDEYLRHWNGWIYDLVPIEAGSFTEFRREITSSGRRLQIPFIDLLREVGEYDKQADRTTDEEYALLANIADLNFKNIALGTPEAPESWGRSNLSKNCTLYVFDDNKEIQYAVRGLTNGKLDDDLQIVKTIRNPLGRNSIAVGCGNYKAGLPFEFRFNPMALSLERNYMMLMILNSLLASLMNEAMKANVQVLGDTVGAALVGEGMDQTRQEIMSMMAKQNEGEMMLAFGELQSRVKPEAIQLIQDVRQGVIDEIGRQRPSAAVNDLPSESGDKTATQDLASLQAEEYGYGSTLKELVRIVENKRAGWEYASTYGLNPTYEKGKGKASNIKIIYRTSGHYEHPQERTVEPGTDYEFSPEDLDFEKVVQITPKSTDQRLQAMEADRAKRDYYTPDGVPLITRRQLLERHGVTNVDKQFDDLNFEQLNKIETPRILGEVSDRLSAYIAVEMGMDPLEVQSPAIQGPAPASADTGGAPPQQGSIGGGQTMNAPVVPEQNPGIMAPIS